MNKIIEPTLLWDSKETIQYIPPTIVGRKVKYDSTPLARGSFSKIYTIVELMGENLLIEKEGKLLLVDPEDCKLIEEKE